MANGAINIKPFAATLKQFMRDWHRECCNEISSNFAGVERFIFMQLATSDCMGYQLARRHLIVLEKVVFAERFAGGLIEHVAAARGEEQRKEAERERKKK